MPSFRNSKQQAQYVVKKHLAIKQAKHKSKLEGKIFSVGTARNYQQALANVAMWLKDNRLGGLVNLDAAVAIQYLEDRSQTIRQKLLDQERQAIQVCLGKKLPVIKSELQQVVRSRAYSAQQVDLIAEAQTAKNRLATRIAYAAGLRAHELLTIRKAKEQRRSKHRIWSRDRFKGREGILYTVVGKGGLIREVMLPFDLSNRLEEQRLQQSRKIIDRQIIYYQHYDISGGKKWTNSFSAASKRLFGWSHGAHGLRHSYAQQRMEELQQSGLFYKDALAIVSQELGHFRPDITEVYLI